MSLEYFLIHWHFSLTPLLSFSDIYVLKKSGHLSHKIPHSASGCFYPHCIVQQDWAMLPKLALNSWALVFSCLSFLSR